MICHPCKYQLEKSFQFRKKCEEADNKLRKSIKEINQRLEDAEGMEQDGEPSPGNSKRVKQLLADLVATKSDLGEVDGEPIEVTEEELVGGYILGRYFIFQQFW